MSEHSKGPELTYGAHGQIIVDEDGDLRADLYNKLGVPSELANKETDALGRKMAASPELVEALRWSQAMLRTLIDAVAPAARSSFLAGLADNEAALEKAGVKS